MTERTTVRLPKDLLIRAKRKAAAERRTLTSLIEEGLRAVTAEPGAQEARVASRQQGDGWPDAGDRPERFGCAPGDG